MSSSYIQSAPAGAKDFFRDASANLPTGTNDTTKDIQRLGKVGINNLPLSYLDVDASFGLNISTFTTNITATDLHHTLVKISGTAGSVTLPAASTAFRRQYRIVNRGLTNLVISTFVDPSAGVSRTVVFPNESVLLQSDATDWIMVDRSGPEIKPITQISGNITLNFNHHTVVSTAGLGNTITLPVATTCPGLEYIIVNAGNDGMNISPGFTNPRQVVRNFMLPGETVVIQSTGLIWRATSETKVSFYEQRTLTAGVAATFTHNLNRFDIKNIQTEVRHPVTGEEVQVAVLNHATNACTITSPITITNADVTIR